MRRWASGTFIACYLSALVFGIFSNAMKFGNNSHPAVYYVIWDMFCGWSAYESRYHMVGEGVDGKYYELGPAPWGRFSPYGDLPRHHYDAYGHTFHRMALNVLKNTQHEEMRRIIVLEECWHKKYNLPDHLWNLRFDEPKDPQSYFWLRAAFDGQGQILQLQPDFVTYQLGLTIADNPRLIGDARRGRPFYAVNPEYRSDAFRDPSAWAGPTLSNSPLAH